MNDILFSCFIPGSVPSGKNSRIISKNRRASSFPSKALATYLKATKHLWDDESLIAHFRKIVVSLEKPIVIRIHFVRKTKQKYDWVNMVQTVQDLIVRNGWIEDDNVEEMLPMPYEINGMYNTISKEDPGVYIAILLKDNIVKPKTNKLW